MIVNPFSCEVCDKKLQPEDIGVDVDSDGKLLRICMFCGNIIIVGEEQNV